MILDFTPPTKGLHGGPLETLPKGIPVTLAKYLRGNQERKDEGETEECKQSHRHRPFGQCSLARSGEICKSIFCSLH